MADGELFSSFCFFHRQIFYVLRVRFHVLFLLHTQYRFDAVSSLRCACTEMYGWGFYYVANTNTMHGTKATPFGNRIGQECNWMRSKSITRHEKKELEKNENRKSWNMKSFRDKEAENIDDCERLHKVFVSSKSRQKKVDKTRKLLPNSLQST